MMLALSDYRRYGRQMILDGFGLPGQVKLRSASVAIVGAGGLGCPALQYLVAAGVGRIGIIDHDTVDISNLQRQVVHSEATLGMSKAESAAQYSKRLNSAIRVDAITEALRPSNALDILRDYDIILDCTDNAPTRYLLSDTAVALGKPLVSGAAQKYEGQLCVYNLGADGPCYRCLFPKPPQPEVAPTCEETGILGPVTGIIGTMQALETIKILAGLNQTQPSLLLFSALSLTPFRTVKLRSRKPSCPACGTLEQKSGQISETDYVAFCGGPRPDWQTLGLASGSQGHRISVTDLKDALDSDDLSIIDVRPTVEFGICSLPGSKNIPLPQLVANPAEVIGTDKIIYLVCRLGNDSQIAADALRSLPNSNILVQDVIGGLSAWSKHVDPTFPIY